MSHVVLSAPSAAQSIAEVGVSNGRNRAFASQVRLGVRTNIETPLREDSLVHRMCNSGVEIHVSAHIDQSSSCPAKTRYLVVLVTRVRHDLTTQENRYARAMQIDAHQTLANASMFGYCPNGSGLRLCR